MKVELNPKTNEWEVLPDNSPNGIYIDGYLKQRLDNVLKIQKKKWDAVILIDGRERSGKSTLGTTCGWYLSKKKLTIHNFAKGLDDAREKIESLPDESILIVDEGSLVFNTQDSRVRENVELQKIMDVVGQKNMIFIVILPSIFDVSRAIATRRSLFLLHVYTDSEWNRGQFGYYGEESKEILYVEGKRNYGKYTIDPEFVARFTNFEAPFHEEYLKLKQATMIHALHNSNEKKESKELTKLRAEKRTLLRGIFAIHDASIKKEKITFAKLAASMGMSVRNLQTLKAEVISNSEITTPPQSRVESII